jgi:hypothetical protein
MYTLHEAFGKGKGLVATRKIPMGTRILSEELSDGEDAELLVYLVDEEMDGKYQGRNFGTQFRPGATSDSGFS